MICCCADGYDLLDDWPDEAVFILIDLYKRHEHLLKLEEVTFKQFWTMIASQLAKKNYNPTAFQCRLKMKDLNYTYRTIKNNAREFNNRTWKFFDVSDKVNLVQYIFVLFGVMYICAF